MSRRILVADDSSTIQKVVKIAFSQYPVEIMETGSYVEALHEVQRERPDVLILDACLPGANVPEDFLKLSAESGNAPILLLIGSYQSVDEDEFRQAGLATFLKKPFDSVEIVEQVEAMVGSLGDLEDHSYETKVTQGPTGTTVSEPPSSPPAPGEQAGFGNPPTGSYQAPHDPTRPPESFASLGSDEDADTAEEVPFQLTEEGRRGRPAFDEKLATRTNSTTVIIPPPPPMATNPGGNPAPGSAGSADETKVKEPLPPIPPGTGEFGTAAPTRPRNMAAEDTPSTGVNPADIEAMLPSLVRDAVENYCERHFKSLVREVITAELRRLADEKARHLVDH